MTSPLPILAEENEPYVFLNVSEILLKILDQILEAPESLNFRTLRLDNKIVSGAILSAEGGLQCLTYFGFDMNDEAFIMSRDVPITRLQSARNELLHLRKTFLAKTYSEVSSVETLAGRLSLFEIIRSCSERVLLYENERLQNLAKKEIPFDKLLQRMNEKPRDKVEDLGDICLLYELMMWFKTEFFTWMDHPKCKECNNSSVLYKGLSRHPINSINSDRVELYECERCQERLIFPRYNDPLILLETRTGRCGEWANCFTLMCRSLGYDARYVVDRTDHVWTEVYSNSQKRWIHCDPCEGLLDTPLVYELGWKKTLSYVLAFSKDEVQDVTWRYTTQFSDVRARRKQCPEEALLELLFHSSKELQASLPIVQRRALEERRVRECAEFLTPPRATKQYDGRSSGSLLWRLNREECTLPNEKHVWQPNGIELERKRFLLRYSSAKDEYHRVETSEIISGWKEGVYECTKIFRKLEHDWKQCYLCRTDDQSAGSVTWKFSSKRSSLVIDRIIIKYRCSVFHSGSARLILCNNDSCISLDSTENTIETDEFRGTNEVSLIGLVDADDRSTGSWQHAQLFRQSIDDDDFPFEINITFYDNPSIRSPTIHIDSKAVNQEK